MDKCFGYIGHNATGRLSVGLDGLGFRTTDNDFASVDRESKGNVAGSSDLRVEALYKVVESGFLVTPFCAVE